MYLTHVGILLAHDYSTMYLVPHAPVQNNHTTTAEIAPVTIQVSWNTSTRKEHTMATVSFLSEEPEMSQCSLLPLALMLSVGIKSGHRPEALILRKELTGD